MDSCDNDRIFGARSGTFKGLGAAFALCVACMAGSGCSDGYIPPAPDADGGDAAGFGDTGDTASPADTGPNGSDPGSESDTSGMMSDTGGMDSGGAEGDVNSSGCTRNNDGVVTRDEVVFEPGIKATFKVAHDVEVDTAGTMKNGSRYWNLDKNYSGDEFQILAFQPLKNKWFRSDFPDGDYAMKLAGDSEELGVFDATPSGLYLLGVVSPEDGFTTTNIEYNPPVEILHFPLKEGTSWKTETTARGTHELYSPTVPISWDETYKNQVDAAGTVDTPYGEFQALRVRTVLERNQRFSGFQLGEVRTFAFVAECFGTVATIRSKDGEDETEFSEAAEIRRLSP